MEKKIEVVRESDGKVIKIMPHMLADLSLFGVTEVKRKQKEPPKELTAKPIILPADPITEEVKEEIVPEPKILKAVKKPVTKKK